MSNRSVLPPSDSRLQQWYEDLLLVCDDDSIGACSTLLGIATGSAALREVGALALKEAAPRQARLRMSGDSVAQWELALRLIYPLETRPELSWVSRASAADNKTAYSDAAARRQR